MSSSYSLSHGFVQDEAGIRYTIRVFVFANRKQNQSSITVSGAPRCVYDQPASQPTDRPTDRADRPTDRADRPADRPDQPACPTRNPNPALTHNCRCRRTYASPITYTTVLVPTIHLDSDTADFRAHTTADHNTPTSSQTTHHRRRRSPSHQ